MVLSIESIITLALLIVCCNLFSAAASASSGGSFASSLLDNSFKNSYFIFSYKALVSSLAFSVPKVPSLIALIALSACWIAGWACTIGLSFSLLRKSKVLRNALSLADLASLSVPFSIADSAKLVAEAKSKMSIRSRLLLESILLTWETASLLAISLYIAS